jgi:methylmalonyl-CoA/ethylmalonyl-CoA epimerase
MADTCSQPGLSTIGQIELASRDIPRSVGFYRDKLGIRLLFQAPGVAFFDCDGIRLMLGLAQNPSSSILYFKVNDIESAAAELRIRGVEFERDPHLVAKMPGHDLWFAFFRDPDGNRLALMCEISRKP